jgi:hypothetical protein
MTEQELRELERLAQAATPGPWAAIGDPWGDGSVVRTGMGDPHGQRIICFIDPSMEEYEEELFGHRDYITDMAFIAAANPQTIQRLINRNRELKMREEALFTLVEKVSGDDALAVIDTYNELRKATGGQPMNTQTWECPACQGHNDCKPSDFEAVCRCGQKVNLTETDGDGWRIAIEVD